MRVDVFTIFPNIVDNFCSESLLGKCRESGLLDLFSRTLFLRSAKPLGRQGSFQGGFFRNLTLLFFQRCLFQSSFF